MTRHANKLIVTSTRRSCVSADAKSSSNMFWPRSPRISDATCSSSSIYAFILFISSAISPTRCHPIRTITNLINKVLQKEFINQTQGKVPNTHYLHDWHILLEVRLAVISKTPRLWYSSDWTQAKLLEQSFLTNPFLLKILLLFARSWDLVQRLLSS